MKREETDQLQQSIYDNVKRGKAGCMHRNRSGLKEQSFSCAGSPENFWVLVGWCVCVSLHAVLRSFEDGLSRHSGGLSLGVDLLGRGSLSVVVLARALAVGLAVLRGGRLDGRDLHTVGKLLVSDKKQDDRKKVKIAYSLVLGRVSSFFCSRFSWLSREPPRPPRPPRPLPRPRPFLWPFF